MMYDPSDYTISTVTPIVPCHWHGTASPYSSAFWEIHHDGSYDLIPTSLSKWDSTLWPIMFPWRHQNMWQTAVGYRLFYIYCILFFFL